MTRQEMFDKAARGVIAQGGLSVDPNTERCLYIYGKRRCAVGHLLSSEDARKADLARSNVGSLVRAGLLQADDKDFLIDLQRAHDACVTADFPASFRRRMRAVARQYGLSAAVLDEVG